MNCFYIMVSFPSAVDKPAISHNPLIRPSTCFAGKLGDAQLQLGGPRRPTCLDLPRDLVLGRLSCLNLLGNPSDQGSQEVNMPQPAQGPNSQEADMPRPARDSISSRLSCLDPHGDPHPDPGMPGSQAATILGRISVRKTHP